MAVNKTKTLLAEPETPWDERVIVSTYVFVRALDTGYLPCFLREQQVSLIGGRRSFSLWPSVHILTKYVDTAWVK